VYAKNNTVLNQINEKGIKLVKLIQCAITELFSLILASALYPTALFRENTIINSDPPNQPILLVHGYLHNKSAWIYLKTRLEKAGYAPIYTINMFPPYKSIENFAEQVKEKAKKIEKETGGKNLILIGHSMGGVVSSYYAEYLATKDGVTQVITLGSPLHGTLSAYFGLGTCAKQMRLNSSFVKELAERILKNTKVEYCHIASETDNFMYPKVSPLMGKNATKEVMLQGYGHTSLLYSSVVANKIIEWLPPIKQTV